MGLGGYKFSNVIMQQNSLINTFNIQYSRKVTDNLFAYTQYTKAPIKGWLLAEVNFSLAKESIGKLTNFMKYNYFDIGLQYQLIRYKNHTISSLGALSITYGKNRYLTHVVWSDPEPGEPYGHPFHSDQEYKIECYFGGIAGLRNDYAFWKNRINIGIDIAARYYFGKKNANLDNPHPNTQVPNPNINEGRHNFPFQINYGVHLGYNF